MKQTKQKGLSLVELIIGIALAAVIIAGIIQVFLSNRTAFNVTESLVRIQENGRFAVNYIGNAIRQSGSYGCVPVYSPTQQNIQSTIGGFNNFDTILPATADGAPVAGSFPAPDTLQLLQLTENSAQINANIVAPGALALFPNTANIADGDWLLVSNCLVGDYVEAGPATTAASLDVSGSANFRATQYNRLDTVTMAHRIRLIEFSVDQANETLRVNIDNDGNQDLIDGIENIQFSYGVDTDGDFVPNYFDDWNNVPVADRQSIIAIKVMVLAVSNLDVVDITSDPQTISFNNQDLLMTDRRLRKVFESVVTLRNEVN